ncbi:6-phosphogluconate dehydrogenase C-terminal domain-like protein [Aureobasidium sp. EXF-12298]|nr:6-phosphogluconate dehydrogenase C-terminal domain-like protein [Aureobasidium sp. EXF-12298]
MASSNNSSSAEGLDIKKIAVIGSGSMGGGMALLFAENGCHVSLEDPSEEAMDGIVKQAKEEGFGDRISKHSDYKSLCDSLDSPKVFVFSLPHGSVGDGVLAGLMPYLEKGDIIIDCGNEHWKNTERRQGKCVTRGIRYIGCGVSGGYQAARRGPSMCPGADDQSLDLVLPFLRKVAAKDPKGRPCVGKAGTGGAGHYVKMIHNGIEHGMMSAISEAWGIMRTGLGLSEDEIGDIFEKWNTEGELQGTFLVKIGADICRTKDPKNGERVLETVEDKVVQDITGEEGTGIWSNEEAVGEHIPAPTLSSAHFFRLASADRAQRDRAQKTFGGGFPAQKLDVKDKTEFLEDLRVATYTACLAAYVQGINVIDHKNREVHWNINFSEVLQIWRAGCIIQADYIASLLEPIFAEFRNTDTMNLLFEKTVASDLKKGQPALKRVVVQAVLGDHVVPAISSSLDYIKYQTGLELPTQFYEAELDYFGKHMYDKKGEDPKGAPTTGKYHFEWKRA